jgi:hypothetical protein
MQNRDLTVIYYTANFLNESFAAKVRRQLLLAIGDLPLISLSKKPLDFGINICEGDTERSVINIYKAVLAGAKTASTKFVALAEDDTLYPPEHFYNFLPPEDTFAYNLCKWNIYTWSKPPFFSLKFRKTLSCLIAPRKLLITELEERFARYPDTDSIPLKWMGEPGRTEYEKNLGITPRKAEEFFSYVPIIVFSHPDALGYQTQGNKKKAGNIRAFDIPYWGTAQNVMENFYL